MDKKELRQQRVKNYFIEATCDIIRKEGIKGLNIRKVADAAGYHYSTIYKYFKDFPHLIAISVFQFLEEALKYINENTFSQDPVEDYINSWGAFCRYSLDNINIFNSIFIEGYGDIDRSEIEGIFGQSPLFKDRQESIIKVSQALKMPPEKVIKLDNSIMSLCIGSIVLYSSGRSDISSEEIINNNIESIRLIIDSYTTPK
jgi:AcrR family transcriptional regulator